MRKKWYRPVMFALLLTVSCACGGRAALAADEGGLKEAGEQASVDEARLKKAEGQISAAEEELKEVREQISADTEDLEKDAQQVVDDMLAGNFGDVTEKFDETMAAALSEEALKASWNSVAILLGEPAEMVSVESMEVSGSHVCVVTQAFENSNLQIQISYDEDRKISGLYMRPVAAVQKTEKPENPGEAEDSKKLEETETLGTEEQAAEGAESEDQTELNDEKVVGTEEQAAEEKSGDESQTVPKEGKTVGEEDQTTEESGEKDLAVPEESEKENLTESGLEEEETAKDDGYEEFELTVMGDPSCPLGAALTLPRDVEKPPVVILVQGSGSSNRDEQVGENRPFADIAHGLAQRGIAVLRYDKRFFAYPERAMEISDLNLREEYLDDVSAAIALMQEDERVDGSRIFVLGHSLGGSLVPAIAAEHSELSGIISMAGSLRPLWEISYDQNQELLSTMDRDSLPEEQQELLETQIEQLEADMAVLRGDELDKQPADASLLGMPAGYWQSIKEYCGMNFIDEVEMPILVLQGNADFQVFPDKDYMLWQETLADRENAEFHLYEGLNHLMMKTQGKRDVSEYETAGHVDEQVIEDIAAFVKAAA